MNEFGYLSVFLSMILGLAVSQIMGGARGCLLARSRVREYWPTHLWAVFLLVVCTQFWWSMYGLRARMDWTFGEFAMLLALTITIFLLTGLVYPDFLPDRTTDLREHYFAQRRHFFALLIVLALMSFGRALVLHHRLPLAEDLHFHFTFLAMAFSGLLIKHERYHKGLIVVASGVLALYVTALFTRLQ